MAFQPAPHLARQTRIAIKLHLPPDEVAPVRLDDEVADYRDRVSDHLPVAAVLRPILPLVP